MSQENVERLRVVFEQLFNDHRLDPELLAEDAEWVNAHGAVEPKTWRGADAFNAAIAAVFAVWDDVRFDTERVIDNGDDVIALGLLHRRVRAVGMEVDSPHGEIWTFRGGRVVRMRWFNTHRAALEAVGLREYAQTDHAASTPQPDS